MLTHYADGGKGVILEIELPASMCDRASEVISVEEIKYGDMFKLRKPKADLAEKAREILTHKTKSWEYEREVRAFTRERFVKVKIKKIILGPRISKDDKYLIKRLTKRLNKKIEIINWNNWTN